MAKMSLTVSFYNRKYNTCIQEDKLNYIYKSMNLEIGRCLDVVLSSKGVLAAAA